MRPLGIYLIRISIYILNMIHFLVISGDFGVFSLMLTDIRTHGHTDIRTDGRTDGRTHPLIEMRRHILKWYFFAKIKKDEFHFHPNQTEIQTNCN